MGCVCIDRSFALRRRGDCSQGLVFLFTAFSSLLEYIYLKLFLSFSSQTCISESSDFFDPLGRREKRAYAYVVEITRDLTSFDSFREASDPLSATPCLVYLFILGS